jgi:hypothetical protein
MRKKLLSMPDLRDGVEVVRAQATEASGEGVVVTSLFVTV